MLGASFLHLSYSLLRVGNWLIWNRQKMFSGCSTISSTGRQHHRSINHALQANGELMRLPGLPARGWYPKQRHARSSASTENLDRLHQGSMRAWDASASRKPTTLPPNMTPPKFFNKSPREALRRVTSLLINRKGITFMFLFISILMSGGGLTVNWKSF